MDGRPPRDDEYGLLLIYLYAYHEQDGTKNGQPWPPPRPDLYQISTVQLERPQTSWC